MPRCEEPPDLGFAAAFLAGLPVCRSKRTISNLEISRANFRSWQTCILHITSTTMHPHTREEPSPSMGGEGVPSPFKVCALGSHVAVRDSPYPVAHSPCLAGVEWRDRVRSLRDPDPGRARRVFALGWLGCFTGCVGLGLAVHGVLVVRVRGLAMVHVASTPRLPMATSAFIWVFFAVDASVPLGGAPVALSAWHVTESSLARPERAETGLIGRSPTTLVGVVGS